MGLLISYYVEENLGLNSFPPYFEVDKKWKKIVVQTHLLHKQYNTWEIRQKNMKKNI